MKAEMEPPNISRAMARLILMDHVSPDVVALAGEVITLDAKLDDYNGIKSRLKTSAEFKSYFDAYNEEFSRCMSIVDEFSKNQDEQTLLSGLSDVRGFLDKWLA